MSIGLTCRRELHFPQNILLVSSQLIAWEPTQEEEVTMVTARPNFQDNIHVGFVSGLKKFTEYFTSVLCFTTPGDGPRSSPQLVRTHEDGRCLRPPTPNPDPWGVPGYPGAQRPSCIEWLCSDSNGHWWVGDPFGNSTWTRGTPELQ